MTLKGANKAANGRDMDTESLTTQEWAQKIGDQIRSLRLRKNIEQTSVANQSGVSLSALKNLESGKGASIKTLIKVLRALDRVEWLTTLVPPITISPLQMLARKNIRMRARQRKTDEI
jgi:transcriptional regulator with XRE-family HTH domain